MLMESYELSKAQWDWIDDFLQGRPGHAGLSTKYSRSFVDGVLWVLRSSAHWKDLRAKFGDEKSVDKRFNRCSRFGIWQRILQGLLDDPDDRYVMIDPTVVQVRQQATCGREGQSETVGHSRVGLAIKIHLAWTPQHRLMRPTPTSEQSIGGTPVDGNRDQGGARRRGI